MAMLKPRRRLAVVGLIAFLTLVDLFATQAIAPALAAHFAVTPAAMGLAINACTLGMALAALAVAVGSGRVDRRRGVAGALALLALPTAALAWAPGLAGFAALRVLQGLAMAVAFVLTLSHLAEHGDAGDTAAAFAAYVTGNVASNLFGRLLSASMAEMLGLAGTFQIFALLNLAGAALAWRALGPAPTRDAPDAAARAPDPARAGGRAALAAAWRDPVLRHSFGIGFLILFAFIGVFTFVNFVVVRPPVALPMMAVGALYFVFAPALVTTPLAGSLVQRLGSRRPFLAALAAAGAGLPLLLWPTLPAIVTGLALVGSGTFFAQAVATGFTGGAARARGHDAGVAGGLYLACYFFGGLVGSAVVGAVFGRLGWGAALGTVALALTLAAWLARSLEHPPPGSALLPSHDVRSPATPPDPHPPLRST